MKFQVIKNYCFLNGKWFHLVRDLSSRREVITSDANFVKKHGGKV